MADAPPLPPDLPVPVDDGAADGLVGRRLPELSLPATDGTRVALGDLGPGTTLLLIYPRTKRPGEDSPPGWSDIPGARGCSNELCNVRDVHDELHEAGVDRVLGLSSQVIPHQQEMVQRFGLPFPVLSDPDLELAQAMAMPVFTTGGLEVYKRQTLVVVDGVIEHVFYPIFPPDQHGEEVLAWLRAGRRQDDPVR